MICFVKGFAADAFVMSLVSFLALDCRVSVLFVGAGNFWYVPGVVLLLLCDFAGMV